MKLYPEEPRESEEGMDYLFMGDAKSVGGLVFVPVMKVHRKLIDGVHELGLELLGVYVGEGEALNYLNVAEGRRALPIREQLALIEAEYRGDSLN